jgi:hypothetical protein
MKGKFSGLCKPLCDGLFAFCSVKEISRPKLGSYLSGFEFKSSIASPAVT